MTKLLLPLLLCFALLEPWCVPPPRKKTVVALIFCDVTNSLTKEENSRTGIIAAKIVESLPPGAQFRIYPIQVQTQLPAHIQIDIDGDGKEDEDAYREPPPPTDDVEKRRRDSDPEYQRKLKAVRDARWQQIPSQINALYDQLNKGPDNRSCIINVLGFASNKFQTEYGDDGRYELRLYLVSDMIEECNVTPLDGKVEMDKPDIEAEIKRAEGFKSEWSLAPVQIYCIFPSTFQTHERRRPSREQVKRFWNTMFRACGIEESDFREGQVKWYDSGELPEPQMRETVEPGG